MRLTTRSQFIEIVQHQYFGSMALALPEKIMPLLSDAAVLTGFFGSNAPRLVRHRPGAGEESFERFLSAMHAEFTLAYTDFEHFIDVDAQRCACTFLLEVAPRGPTSTSATRVLRNCNFFQFEQGLITAVAAYFASPPIDVDPWRR